LKGVIKIQAKKVITDFIENIRSNFMLVIKGAGAAILLILGPLIAILIRISKGNWFLILVVSLIFEIFGLLIFWMIIKEDYFKTIDEPEDKS
jgi:predicted ABC-type exoprotein transport system permease subunit